MFQFKSQWVSNDSHVTPKEFYNDVVYSLEDVVLNVLFNLIKPINGNKNPKVSEEIIPISIILHAHTLVEPDIFVGTSRPHIL